MTRATTVWRVAAGGAPNLLEDGHLELEKELEDWIEQQPAMVEPGLLILARQLRTEGGELDLLGLDRDGRLVVIELKRDKAYRDVLAQVLDYAACVAAWSFDELRQNVDENRNHNEQGGTFKGLLDGHLEAPEQWVADEPRVVVVGTGADPSLRRIVDYLSASYDLPINGVFLDIYADAAGGRFIVRSAVVEDDVAARTGQRRGRGGITDVELRKFAEDRGTLALCASILDAWKAAVGRDGRPERKGRRWSLPQRSDARGVAACLWPVYDDDDEAAWFELRFPSLCADTGHAEAEIKGIAEERGVVLHDGSWARIGSPEDATRLALLVSTLYPPGMGLAPVAPPDEVAEEQPAEILQAVAEAAVEEPAEIVAEPAVHAEAAEHPPEPA